MCSLQAESFSSRLVEPGELALVAGRALEFFVASSILLNA
jgi:hypothetical protein